MIDASGGTGQWAGPTPWPAVARRLVEVLIAVLLVAALFGAAELGRSGRTTSGSAGSSITTPLSQPQRK